MNNKKYTSGSTTAWVIILVVLILVAVGAYYYFNNMRQSQTISQQPISSSNQSLSNPNSSVAPVVGGPILNSAPVIPTNVPCDSLLTVTDMKGIFGAKNVADQGVNTSLPGGNCIYVFDINPTNGLFSLDVTLKPTYRNISNTVCTLSKSCDPIPGIGDGTFLGEYNGYKDLYSQSGSHLISITGFPLSSLSNIEQLTRLMISRLPK